MKKFLRPILAGVVLSLVLVAGIVIAQKATGTVEVLHWWTSGGEAAAVDELKRILREEGHEWKDFAVAGGSGTNAMTVLKSRAVAGDPPTAAQVKGPFIQEWAEQGFLGNLNSVAQANNWNGILPDFVQPIMQYQGQYVAVPVNIHRLNWLYANPAVFQKAGAKIPKTWSQFVSAAKRIQNSGDIAVAHGGQAWQDGTVFEIIALGTLGVRNYNRAFVQLNRRTLSSSRMARVFSRLREYKSFTDRDAPGREWNVATGMVIDGKAGMQIMGDWAKGEFVNAGKVAGKDYVAVPAPGTSGRYSYNVDSFIMFDVKDPAASQAQQDLAKAILDEEFQEIFNLKKGSIPVRLGMDLSKFDQYSQQSASDLEESIRRKTTVPSLLHDMAARSDAKGALLDVITRFYNSPDMSPRAAARELGNAIAKLN